MPAQRRRPPRGRPRRAAPKALPDDLYAYGDDPAPSRRNPSPEALDIGKLPVFDDWPDNVPVTVAEVDIFERYFGDVLDRLFYPPAAPQSDKTGLKVLSHSDNKNRE